MPAWDGIIPKRDIEVYQSAGYGSKLVPGKRPAIFVIDVTVAFVGDKPEPILDSIKKYPNSCGEDGWKSVFKIKELLESGREKKIPIVYTAAPPEDEFALGMWTKKHPRTLEQHNLSANTPDAIPKEIAPHQGDIIIQKLKPSAFFGTPLMSHLVALGIDTLIVTGCTTSGCVRATVVDGFSSNYAVLVVEDCSFDRGQLSHAVNLFDMNQKYANVVSLADAKKYISSL